MERYDKFYRGIFYVELWMPTTPEEALECLVKVFRAGIKVKSGNVPLSRFPTAPPGAEDMKTILIAADTLIAAIRQPTE